MGSRGSAGGGGGGGMSTEQRELADAGLLFDGDVLIGNPDGALSGEVADNIQDLVNTYVIWEGGRIEGNQDFMNVRTDQMQEILDEMNWEVYSNFANSESGLASMIPGARTRMPSDEQIGDFFGPPLRGRAAYQAEFESRILSRNPGFDYDNALGWVMDFSDEPWGIIWPLSWQ